MTHLSELAQSLETNSKQQTELTKQAVSKEFKSLNKFINTEVVKSASETRNAIRELNQQHLNQYKGIKLALLIASLLIALLGGMVLQANLDLDLPVLDVINIENTWEEK
ncbi:MULTISPECIES: MbeB family mobilization protein [unclassified Pseudoalteromonas]|uniref:MbeB family mobilization protein n=1 Tax=unclassified Pseudoalteromonas TaxID=194690 RepID=UPI0009777591